MQYKFATETTPTYAEAVGALRRLALREGLGQAHCAVADALAGLVQHQFAKQPGVKESQVRVLHWKRLLGQKSVPNEMEDLDDHKSLWNREGKPWAYVSQPYVLRTNDLREIVSRCDQGLNAYLCADASWHFPGKTLALILRRNAPND